jgi:hypothetical protein
MLNFVHRPTFYKQNTAFREFQLLSSSGRDYVLKMDTT